MLNPPSPAPPLPLIPLPPTPPRLRHHPAAAAERAEPPSPPPLPLFSPPFPLIPLPPLLPTLPDYVIIQLRLQNVLSRCERFQHKFSPRTGYAHPDTTLHPAQPMFPRPMGPTQETSRGGEAEVPHTPLQPHPAAAPLRYSQPSRVEAEGPHVPLLPAQQHASVSGAKQLHCQIQNQIQILGQASPGSGSGSVPDIPGSGSGSGPEPCGGGGVEPVTPKGPRGSVSMSFSPAVAASSVAVSPGDSRLSVRSTVLYQQDSPYQGNVQVWAMNRRGRGG